MIYYCANNKKRNSSREFAILLLMFFFFLLLIVVKQKKISRKISLSAFIEEEGFENYESKWKRGKFHFMAEQSCF